MKPKNIRHINLDTFNSKNLLIDDYKFDFNVRFICNYLSKEVRKLNISGDGTFKMIGVRLCNSPSECKLVYGTDYADVLCVSLHISEEEQERYNTMTNLADRYEYYLQLLERGYYFASKFKKIPINELLCLHNKFRLNDYKNEWLWKRKVIRNYGICVLFKCYFTTFDFRLELEVYGKHETILLTKGIVLRTGPDEIFYDKCFRKLEIIGTKLAILDFLNKVNFQFDLNLLAEGVFDVQYVNYSTSVCHDDLIKRITW